MTDHNRISSDRTMDDSTRLAERELSAFYGAVTELFGSEQAETSAEDWLRELVERDDLPASPFQWRALTIGAATGLAARVNATAYQKQSLARWNRASLLREKE